MKQIIKNSLENTFKEYDYLYSEDDLKFKLAWEIKRLSEDLTINLEVPNRINYLNCDHEKILCTGHTDIVIEDNANKYPLEIKYKTNEIKCKNKLLVKEHGARDEGRFSVRRDIFRIEQMLETNNEMPRGFVLFVTNDPKYRDDDNKMETFDKNYRFTDKMIYKHDTGWNYTKWSKKNNNISRPEKGEHWTTTGTRYYKYNLNKDYAINWADIENNKYGFMYFLIEISS